MHLPPPAEKTLGSLLNGQRVQSLELGVRALEIRVDGTDAADDSVEEMWVVIVRAIGAENVLIGFGITIGMCCSFRPPSQGC